MSAYGSLRIAAAVLFSLTLSVRAQAAPGDLDTSFSDDGILTTRVALIFDVARAVLIQDDGKILAVGTAAVSAQDFAIARYNSDGSLDTSFSGDGTVLTPIGTGHDSGTSAALQSDGKIVVAGGCDVSGSNDFCVARYNVDGSLDTSFSGDGKLTTDLGGQVDQANAVAIQDDGKIVAAGFSGPFLMWHTAVVRYNADGSLDTSFSGDGKLVMTIGSARDGMSGVAIQGDGKIVLAGSARSSSEKFAVLRLNTDGSLDTSFSGDGIQMTSSDGLGSSVALQDDGRIVVAGSAPAPSNDGFAVLRLLEDGSFDTSFSGDGMQAVAIGAAADYATAVAIQQNGKIVLAGHTQTGLVRDFAIARFLADGTLDTTFSGDGKQTTSITEEDFGNGVALQEDGRIVMVGWTRDEDDIDRFGLVRYRGDECGDGLLQLGEECDDGNTAANDCCSPACLLDATDEPCGDPSNTNCTDPDTCDGAGNCLSNHAPDATECRGATGDCDIAEVCSAGSCPSDTVMDADEPCGDPGDSICDHPDSCDGAGACSANQEPGTTECRAATGDCDIAETCSAGSCPGDAFVAADEPCGDPADSVCDHADSCNGAGACLPNQEPDTTTCRAATGECDVAELCSAGSCPSDVLVVAGQPCGNPGNSICDHADSCDGAGACLPNLEPGTTECRAETGDCDVTEYCSAGSCPSNVFVAADEACGDPGESDCDYPDSCDGFGACLPNHETASTSCPDDGNGCTDDQCDGAGSCAHTDNTDPCDDGMVCTAVDTCSGGSCVGGVPPECDDGNPCSQDSCDDSLGCTTTFEPRPAASCIEAPKTSLSIKRNLITSKNQLKWKWNAGGAFDQAALGDPGNDTSYSVCLYDKMLSVPSLVARLDVAAGGLWSSDAPDGLAYKDKEGISDGARKIKIKTGEDGRTKVSLSAGGADLPLITPPDMTVMFSQDPEVVLQLVNSEGLCLTSAFDPESTTGNSVVQFKAKTKP